MAKKDNSGIDIIENSEALKKEFFKYEGLLEKNSKLLTYIGAGIIGLVALYFGYKYYNDTQEKEAQAAIYDAVFSFESDSLSKALKGQGGNEGLLSVADNYGSTKAGKLANLYAGIAYMKEAKYAEAIERLDKFSADDQVLQGRAYSLIGDCYMETKKVEDAIKYYEKAVDFKPNKFATPAYMMKLAGAYTEAKKSKEAISVYADLVDKYPTGTEALLAKKYKSRLETESGE
ncbi:tetratricopeptide repeat protein [Lacihabitans sp. LS3-19]|uniref:tetratricopeptide repeat protein n=1 Tax=Lacihabitans sp. LS3-19 TaxID=2487335 RepID=UPI0020CC2FA7|nr:tetratricopeptide repeat protein [Lacihabitans sp. LS3-19]MCP9766716.1 tetratricopeptide repeat protein [Lacihabitans sp. LS3-19]